MGDMGVGGVAGRVGMEARHGGGTTRISHLDINQGEGPRAIQVAYHDVWLLRQGRAMRQHPLPHLAKGSCPLGHHTRGT